MYTDILLLYSTEAICFVFTNLGQHLFQTFVQTFGPTQFVNNAKWGDTDNEVPEIQNPAFSLNFIYRWIVNGTETIFWEYYY